MPLLRKTRSLWLPPDAEQFLHSPFFLARAFASHAETFLDGGGRIVSLGQGRRYPNTTTKLPPKACKHPTKPARQPRRCHSAPGPSIQACASSLPLRVQEIRSDEESIRVAKAPAFVKRMVNLRGAIVPASTCDSSSTSIPSATPIHCRDRAQHRQLHDEHGG